jgi:hypothetical protein
VGNVENAPAVGNHRRRPGMKEKIRGKEMLAIITSEVKQVLS